MRPYLRNVIYETKEEKVKIEKKKVLSRISQIITWLFRFTLVITAIVQAVNGNMSQLGIIAVTFVLTFYRGLLRKIGKIEISDVLHCMIILFMFGTQYLGTILDVYGKIPLWDALLHGLSGILFFYIALTLIKEIEKRTNTKTNFVISMLLAFCFVLSIGVVWELFEFCMDKFFSQNMQRTLGEIGQNAIIDTMSDLFAATIGAILATIIEIYKMKRRKKK